MPVAGRHGSDFSSHRSDAQGEAVHPSNVDSQATFHDLSVWNSDGHSYHQNHPNVGKLIPRKPPLSRGEIETLDHSPVEALGMGFLCSQMKFPLRLESDKQIYQVWTLSISRIIRINPTRFPIGLCSFASQKRGLKCRQVDVTLADFDEKMQAPKLSELGASHGDVELLQQKLGGDVIDTYS